MPTSYFPIGLYRRFSNPEDYTPESIAPEFQNDRKIFLKEELEVISQSDEEEDWLREEVWNVCSRRPYIWERPFDYKIENYHSWFVIYAYACVAKHGFISNEDYQCLYKTRAGRKTLRNRVKSYDCLVWYRREDDTGPAPTETKHRRRIVPSSRALSFFPGG